MQNMREKESINIIFQNKFGEAVRVTASSDKEVEKIIKERQGLGESLIEVMIGSNKAIDLTERHNRAQETDSNFLFRR